MNTAAPFSPHPLLRGPHAQTLLGAALRGARPPLPLERVEIATPDGDFLHLDRPPGPTEGPQVLLLHGLAGSSRSGIIQSMMSHLARLGLGSQAMNLRGCSGVPNRAPSLYHAGRSEDLEAVVEHLLARPGAASLALVGFSLGGNLLLKWLGERGATLPARIRCAAAVSVPYDLGACSHALEASPLSRLYRRVLIGRLKARVRGWMGRHPGRLDPGVLARVRTFEEFDELITAPLHGFRGAADYWARCSARAWLEPIACPTLLLSSHDDPFLPEGQLDSLTCSENPHLVRDLPAHGGHLGFLDPRLEGWCEARIGAFLSDHLQAGHAPWEPPR